MEQAHVLVVTYFTQGHINPVLRLARRLARSTGARLTFSTAVSAHRRMFPHLSSPYNQHVCRGLITYAPYSDGYDSYGEYKDGRVTFDQFLSQSKLNGTKSLAAVIRSLQLPVTHIIFTMFVPWVADVARELSIPSTLMWIQPAAALLTYHHYFQNEEFIRRHVDDKLFLVNINGLPPLRIRDLPSFLTLPSDHPLYAIVTTMGKALEMLNNVSLKDGTESAPLVLVNSFDDLEADTISAIECSSKIEILTVGPLLDDQEDKEGDVFIEDEKAYMEWLDSKPQGSVVYVSFGSLCRLSEKQNEEIASALRRCGQPYLWVLRKDSRGEQEEAATEEGDGGMVVEWCNQAAVLSHRAVGCFVTHCGWNSSSEGIAYGVPMVGVPQFSDQLTIAAMMEGPWGNGVRAEVDDEGVVDAAELLRCVDVVMGGGERGEEIRRMVKVWKEKSREALSERGTSHRNLEAFWEKKVNS